MVADEFFDLRSRLGAALFALGGIADRAGLQPSRAPLLQSLSEGLKDPLVLVAAGEVNAGKSTLLNALFGAEFCPAGPLPETGSIHWFRYACGEERRVVHEGLEEIGLPHAFLRDFQVVDTPGVNSTTAGHELITGGFLPRADALLYCFPATNPWSAAAWDFLHRIQSGSLKKVILVLQQCDLRTADEVESIAEHMRMVSRQRLGVELPVFPVSARLALLARTSGIDKERLLAESRIAALENQLGHLISGGSAHLAKLVTACSSGQAVLAEIQTRLSAATGRLEFLNQLQQRAARLLADAQHDLKTDAGSFVRQAEAVFQTQAVKTTDAALGARPRFPAQLRKRELPPGGDPEALLLTRLLPPMEAGAAALEEKWSVYVARMNENPGEDIRKELGDRGFKIAPEEFVRGPLEAAVRQIVGAGGLNQLWKRRLRRRRHLMRGAVVVFLLVVAGMAAVGVRGGFTAGQGLAGLAGVIAMMGLGALMLRRETVETRELLQPVWDSMSRTLTSETVRITQFWMHSGRESWQACLEPFHAFVEAARQETGPLVQEVADMAGTLHLLGRALHANVRTRPSAPGEAT